MTAREAWETCDEPSYMLWLYDQLRTRPMFGDKGDLFPYGQNYTCDYIRRTLPFGMLRALSEGK
jgi:hypothetical protein